MLVFVFILVYVLVSAFVLGLIILSTYYVIDKYINA